MSQHGNNVIKLLPLHTKKVMKPVMLVGTYGWWVTARQGRLPSGFQVPSSDIQNSWVGGNWRSVNIFQKNLPDITRLLYQTQKWIMRYSGAKDSPKYCGSGPATFQFSTVIKF